MNIDGNNPTALARVDPALPGARRTALAARGAGSNGTAGGYVFTSPSLRATYGVFRSKPDASSVADELALLRTLLQTVITKVEAKATADAADGGGNGNGISETACAALTLMAREVSECAEKLARIEKTNDGRLPYSYVEQLINLAADTLAAHLPPDKAEAAVADMLAVLDAPSDENELRIARAKRAPEYAGEPDQVDPRQQADARRQAGLEARREEYQDLVHSVERLGAQVAEGEAAGPITKAAYGNRRASR